MSGRPTFWLQFWTIYQIKLQSATQQRAVQRRGSFRQLVGIILRTSDTGWNFYVEEGFRFQVKPRYWARGREKSSLLWQSQDKDRTAAKEQTSIGINDANSILASGMVTCVFFSTFLIFLHFSLLYFVFIYSCPLFNLVAFLVVKNLTVFFADSDTAQKRHSATNGYINFYP